MVYAVLIALWLLPQTRIVQLPDTEIIRRGNFVVAGTVDGYLCYGTKTPLSVHCHRAVAGMDDLESLPGYRQALWWGPLIDDDFRAGRIAVSLLVLLAASFWLLHVTGLLVPSERLHTKFHKISTAFLNASTASALNGDTGNAHKMESFSENSKKS